MQYHLIIHSQWTIRGFQRFYRNFQIFSDCNGTRTHDHLVRKRALNHLAKQSLKLQRSRLFWARSSWHSGNYRVQIHSKMLTWHDKNIQSVQILRLPSFFSSWEDQLSTSLNRQYEFFHFNSIQHLLKLLKIWGKYN